MKNLFKKIALTGLGLLALSGNVKAQDSKPTNPTKINLEGTLVNSSRFWGFPFLDSPMYSQGINFKKGALSGGIIGNRDVNQENWFDIDTKIGYAPQIFDNIYPYLGGVRFDFNLTGEWDNAYLVYGGAAFNAPLNPSLTYQKLIGFGGGEYLEGAVSKKIPINDKNNVSVSGKIGYNKDGLRVGEGFTHAEATMTVPIQFSENMSATPTFNYVHPFGEDVKSGFHGGVTVNYNLK